MGVQNPTTRKLNHVPGARGRSMRSGTQWKWCFLEPVSIDHTFCTRAHVLSTTRSASMKIIAGTSSSACQPTSSTRRDPGTNLQRNLFNQSLQSKPSRNWMASTLQVRPQLPPCQPFNPQRSLEIENDMNVVWCAGYNALVAMRWLQGII